MTQKGFTLVEVMISMFIMAMLTVLVSTSIRSAVQNKKKLEAHMASQMMLFDSLRVLKLDIERAFHYQDVFFEIENQALQEMNQAARGQRPGNANQGRNQVPVRGQGQGPQRMPPLKLTQFLGENNNMHFTTLNHFRTRYNAPESDQMEVGYFLDSCERRDGEGSSQCLWRRSSTQIDDEVEKGGSRVVVSEHVKTFKLMYRNNREDGEWVDQWRSDNKGRADHQNRFPHFVKIELAIDDESDETFRPVQETIVVRVQFPNNEPHLQPQQPGGARQR